MAPKTQTEARPSSPRVGRSADVPMNKREFEDFIFETEVSTRYHEWRRAALERRVAWVRFLSIVGAVLSLITIPSAWTIKINTVEVSSFGIVAIVAAIIGFINLIDLVYRWDSLAIRHAELYRLFKSLQVEIELHRDNWQEYIRKWRGQAETIRIDEPPIYWAVYAKVWNQTIERENRDRSDMRPVGPLQNLFRNWRYYTPEDFPSVS